MRLQGLFSGERYEKYHALLSGAERELAPAAPQQKEKRSDQVIFLERGVVAESGTPDELFLHPKNDRTRQFLAAYVK